VTRPRRESGAGHRVEARTSRSTLLEAKASTTSSSFESDVVSPGVADGCPTPGCHPRGLLLARDKSLSNSCSRTTAFRSGVLRSSELPPIRRPSGACPFPLIVKSLTQGRHRSASRRRSVVDTDELSKERVQFIPREYRDRPRRPIRYNRGPGALTVGIIAISASRHSARCGSFFFTTCRRGRRDRDRRA